MILKTLARKTVFPVLVEAGIEKVFLKFSKGNILNLMYHGVVEKDTTSVFPRHITGKKFEKHLQYFSRNFDILPLSKALELYKEGKTAPRKSITISFDDGYENNLVNALPILEKYKAHCTFFISGICVENPLTMMWSDIVSLARALESRQHMKIGDYVFEKQGRYDLWNSQLNLSAFSYIKGLNPEVRETMLEDMYKRYDLETRRHFLREESWKLMNKQQIAMLSKSNYAEIGSHGHLHYNLAEIPAEKAEFEMKHAKDLLENVIQKPVEMLAFPDGSYNDEVKMMARQIGYRGLIAVNSRCSSDAGEKDVLMRYGVSSTTHVSSNLFFINYAFRQMAYC